MSIEEAIRILDLETSADAIAEIEDYAGFNKTIGKINEACEIACDVMREHLRDVETMFSDKECYEDLRQMSHENGKVWCYYSSDSLNPCGCGSNCYHYEFDGKKIYGVCNACDTDIYEMKNEFVKEKLKQGIWK
ncbi:hypothetical protein [Butyribacter intestini]|uniref:hypothetical protein n=1 Tax=Butyribacter intestini TaxID=1703332 RepID=UPI0022E471EA|nr:hypothetical protein [Butyribacter intestini]